MKFTCRKCHSQYEASIFHVFAIDSLCPACNKADKEYTERAKQAIINLKISMDIEGMPKEKVAPFLQRLKEQGIDVSYFENPQN